MTSLKELLAHGQSPWLDYIRRSLLTTGELRRMVESDGITGVTSNPTIFEKAIAGSQDYDDALRRFLERDPGLPATELFERLAVEDLRAAADVLRPVFDRTRGTDGFVSLEVSPRLAHDTAGTVAEARRLWKEVDRPNLLVKVPGTPEGVPAIEQLISEGISVNVTLLFSLEQYTAVAEAYRRGVARAPDPTRVSSVASVFVSRIDTAVDRALGASPDPSAGALKGKVAIANCKVVYAKYLELFHGANFASLASRGARPQKVLWASTSTKDPHYRDTLYVEELVGPETIDTIPPATVTAFEDHGVVQGDLLTTGLDEAKSTLDRARAVGVDLAATCRTLQDEGVKLFADSYQQLLDSLTTKRRTLLEGRLDPQSWDLGADDAAVDALQARWQADRYPERFWKQDPTLWPAAPPSDVADRMGWLQLPALMHDEIDRLSAFADEVRTAGFRHVIVLGMGGSSLAPDVLRGVFGSAPGFPELLVLDTTHPDAIAALRDRIDIARTLFLVSSKSGTTTEPLSFYRFFSDAVRRSGKDPGPSFVAITDPGTPLEALARKDGFRAVFLALPTVGGRYSALTMFGLVPAALIGIDLRRLLGRAWAMAEACAPTVSVSESPGLALGAVVSALATRGKDKLTFYGGGSLAAFPVWTEQLVAESTGKIGKGIVPVVDEPRVSPEHYGGDRLFVEIQDDGHLDGGLAAHVSGLEAAGFPVVRIRVPEPISIGEEFFRWEVAVASAGSVVGIDPYDQPDVELAKELARQAMAKPAGAPADAGVVTVSVDGPEFAGAFAAWLASARPGDYVGIQAYLAPASDLSSALDDLRRRLLEQLNVATTFGYGPRFLHSTGQLHKGGPNSGLFLQLVDTPHTDLAVPGESFTFAQLIRAQSLGDYQAMCQKQRRVLRIDLGTDARAGLTRLAGAVHG